MRSKILGFLVVLLAVAIYGLMATPFGLFFLALLGEMLRYITFLLIKYPKVAYIIGAPIDFALNLVGINLDPSQVEIPDFPSTRTPEGLRMFLLYASMAGGVMLATFTGWLYSTRLGEWWLRRSIGTQMPTPNQEDLLPDVQEVAQRMGYKRPVMVTVIDAPVLNAFALGKRTVGVTRLVLETLPSHMVEGLVAHEIAHLKRGHTKPLAWIYGAGWAGMVAAKTVHRALSSFARFLLEILGLFGIIPSIVFAVPAVLFWFLHKLSQGVLMLMLRALSRVNEFEADALAARAGYGDALMEALAHLDSGDPSSHPGFLGSLWASHPPTSERLRRIQGEMEQAAVTALDQEDFFSGSS